MSEKTTTRELSLRPHSWRSHEPEEYIEAAESDGKPDARAELSSVEGGRFVPMLKAGHKFFAALDPDERRDWADQNPEMMDWISVWGYLEDLTAFPKHGNIDPRDHAD